MANLRPVLIAISPFNVTAKENNTLVVTVTDADAGDTTTLWLQTELPLGATFNNVTGEFVWMPENMDIINMTFNAKDSRGGVAPSLSITINMCYCSGHGECDFGTFIDGQLDTALFRLVTCQCETGWDGDNCDEDFDGCADTPCFTGTNCTDLVPADEVYFNRTYNCSDCPSGYEEDEGTCSDINECASSNNCAQLCINIEGSYRCTCRDGYRLNNLINCTNIDECVENSHNCEQMCVDTAGGFTCDCLPGFTLRADNSTCQDTLNLCERTPLNCSYACQNSSSGAITCACRLGYTLDADNATCTDENECNIVEKNKCSQLDNCDNFDGGYNCSCDIGSILDSDKRTCNSCPAGSWGEGCAQLCNCYDSTTKCNASTGCERCQAGWTGGACDQDENECLASPCDANSNCTNIVGSFRCNCFEGFIQASPTNCTAKDECASNPCLNNGVCEDLPNAFNCTCAAGYEGDSCQTEINECASTPCENGGTCRNLVNQFQCSCPTSFSGTTCQTAVPSVTTASAGNTNVTTPTGDAIITTTTGDINATKSTGDGNTTAGVAAPTTTVAAANELTTAAVPAATYIYKGSLKMTQKVFVPELLTTTSTQYIDMVNEVKPELEQLFKESAKYKGVSVKLSNFKFSAGSVVVDYTVTMDKPTTVTDLTVTVKAGVSKLNFTVNLASVFFTDPLVTKPSGLDTSTLVAIIISAVLGTVFLILVILFVIFIMRRNLDWRSKGSRSTSDDDSGSLATHTMPHNNRLLMWMNAPLGIPVSGGQMTHHDMQRMRVIEQAASQAKHIDWSAMRNFANARRVLPNRNGQTPWGGQGFVSPPQPKQEEWGWSPSN